MKRPKNALGVGLLILILAVIVFVYWGNRKQVWFCDEIYTYESANGFEQDWPHSNIAKWMTGTDVESFLAADTGKFSLNEITVRLYSDHMPLYFWIFRIISVLFFPGSGTIWIGLAINLFFYLSVVILVYALFVRLTGQPLLSGGVTILTCIENRLMLEQATMLRMYMMLLWAEILLLVLGFRILSEIDHGKISSLFLGVFVISVIGFLTHYDFWIFYAAVAGIFCSWLLVTGVRKKGKLFWKSKEFLCVLSWVGNFVVSILLTIQLFPYCRWNLNRGKGQTALRSLLVFSSEKVGHIVWGYRRLVTQLLGERLPVWAGVVIIFGLLIGAVLILYRAKRYTEATCLTLAILVAQVYQLVVCFTLPDMEEERYLWGPLAIMLLCLAWSLILVINACLERIKGTRAQKTIRRVVAVVVFVCVLAGEYMTIDGGRGIAYLFYEDKDVEKLQQYRDIPWIVYGPTIGVYSYYDWLIPEQICFLSPDNTEEDATAVSELRDADSFILYLHRDYYPYASEFFERELGEGLQGQYLMQSTNLAVYLMTREH